MLKLLSNIGRISAAEGDPLSLGGSVVVQKVSGREEEVALDKH